MLVNCFWPLQDLDLFNYLGNEIVEAQGLTRKVVVNIYYYRVVKLIIILVSVPLFFGFCLYLATILLVLPLEYTDRKSVV